MISYRRQYVGATTGSWWVIAAAIVAVAIAGCGAIVWGEILL